MNVRTHLVVLMTLILSLTAVAAAETVVYPVPEQMELTREKFVLSEATVIVVPPGLTECDRAPAELIQARLADEFNMSLPIVERSELTASGWIAVGSIGANELVRRACVERGWEIDPGQADGASPGPEGYRLQVSAKNCLIAGSDRRGSLYGAATIFELIKSDSDGGLYLTGADITDKPRASFRGVHVYLPAREDLSFFRRYVRDFLLPLKYNTIILEVSGGVRLTRHPEVNIGWREFCDFLLANEIATGRYSVPTAKSLAEATDGKASKNSSHPELGGGTWLEKDEVKNLVDFCRHWGFEVIPEIQSLSHSYYLMTRHPDLAEIPDDRWPDIYCPMNPEARQLYFEVADEICDLLQPGIVALGRDEWWTGGRCPRCRDIPTGELDAMDALAIYRHFKSRGIEVMQWGDPFNGPPGESRVWKPDDWGYGWQPDRGPAGKLTADGSGGEMMVLNWDTSLSGPGDDAETGDRPMGYTPEYDVRQMIGNLYPPLCVDQPERFTRMIEHPRVSGAEVSSWCAANETAFSLPGWRGESNAWVQFIVGGQIMWSDVDLDPADHRVEIARIMSNLRSRISGAKLPSDRAAAADFKTISLGKAADTGLKGDGWDYSGVKEGANSGGRVPFEPGNQCLVVRRSGAEGDLNRSATIPVGYRLSSLVFFHGASGSAFTEAVWKSIHYREMCEILGVYEITYEDGVTIQAPIRYTENILPWNAGGKGGYPLYWADSIPTGKSVKPGPVYQNSYMDDSRMEEGEVTVYAFEWVNPRPIKKVESIRVIGTRKLDDRLPRSLGGGKDSDVYPILLAITACCYGTGTGAE
jgi:hypothetical protein